MARFLGDFQLSSIEHFCLTVELGSFTTAATIAGVTPAAVSRSISRIEKRLGVRLFVRTTRHLRITTAGQIYYDQCRQALTQLSDAELAVSNSQQSPSGLVRISAPTPYVHYRLIPFLGLFQQKFPNIHIDIHSSNRNINFSEESFDLAIRGQAPNDSNLIARKLEDSPLITVATPHYLQRSGIPITLDDLAKHNCIQFELPSTGRKTLWSFIKDGKQVEVETNGSCTCLDDFMATTTLVRQGMGLMQSYLFMVEKELKMGDLVEVLTGFSGTCRPFFLLYPHAQYIPLRVRVFIDYLIEYMRVDNKGLNNKI